MAEINQCKKWADLMLVMDYNNLADLRKHEVEKPAVLLGSFAGVGAIRDPYRMSQAVIRSSLENIATSIDTIMDGTEQKATHSSVRTQLLRTPVSATRGIDGHTSTLSGSE